MFIEAIEMAAKYTRAIYSISRNYRSTIIQPGTATLFFINSDGWALTCGHVANQFAAARTLTRKAKMFRDELSERRGTLKEKRLLKELEKKYGYSIKTIFELHNRFMNCVEGGLEFRVKKTQR